MVCSICNCAATWTCLSCACGMLHYQVATTLACVYIDLLLLMACCSGLLCDDPIILGHFSYTMGIKVPTHSIIVLPNTLHVQGTNI